MQWLVDLALAKDLREAECLLAQHERRTGRRVQQQPRLEPFADYDDEAVALVQHYAHLMEAG